MKQLLSSAMKFRNLTKPKANCPLSVPFLSHPSFQLNTKCFLRELIAESKDFAIPFHLPSHKPREAAHDKLSKALFNFKSWMRWMPQHEQSFQCQCRQLCHQFPDLETIDNHVASSAVNLHLRPSLQQICEASMSSTFLVQRCTISNKQRLPLING